MFDLAPAAGTLPLFLPQAPPDKVSGLIHAATLLSQLLGQGRAIDSRALRSAMENAFCGSDAEGAWVWKDACEACEAAQVMFLRKFGAAMRTRAGSAAAPGSKPAPDLIRGPGQAMLEMLTRLAARLASQTRRSEESEQLQQFSTPITLGFVAAEAAMLTPADLVLEPSAGTGMLAIFAELAKARLVLNEIAETRAGLLARLFRDIMITRHNAEQIHDRLVPARPPIAAPSLPIASGMFLTAPATAARPKAAAPYAALVKRPPPTPDFAELAYDTCDWTPGAIQFTASLYEGYALQSIRIADAKPHPTKLVQSAAMAAVAPPRPSYRPYLPPRLISAGILSDAQLESVIYAGEAHSGHLAGSYTVDETYEALIGFQGDGLGHVTRAAMNALSSALPRRRALCTN